MPSPELPVQWRPRGSQLYLTLLPPLVLVLGGTGSVFRLLEPGGSRARDVLDVVLLAALVMTAVFGLVTALRTRVRLLPECLEVRELGTRVYAWSEITEVRLDRWSGSRRIKITLVDGRTRMLPTPVLGRKADSGRQVAGAIAAIEGRLLPNRPRIGRDEPTSLDDLLGD